ncbi:hypothetical protein AB0H71_25275 [Nocardia sp. NPDC050697]|uniref:hypothetical protein n=1 Tax=Nocardia sp. NPDC050697 TaxID=3155158 RepID=UPI0033EAC9AE
MALVRQDSEGLFVIVGGWIARPPTPETTHLTALGMPRLRTRHAVGDTPHASHRGGTMARVGGEQWFIDREAGTRLSANRRPGAPVSPTPGLADNSLLVPTTAALEAIYVIANAITGDQFVVYAPGSHDERGMYTVAHVTGGTGGHAVPRIHLVHPDDIAAYATGAADRIRRGSHQHGVSVWLDRTTGTLHQHLAR